MFPLPGAEHCHIRAAFGVRSFPDVFCLASTYGECGQLVKGRPRTEWDHGGVAISTLKHMDEGLWIKHTLLRHYWRHWCCRSANAIRSWSQKMGF